MNDSPQKPDMKPKIELGIYADKARARRVVTADLIAVGLSVVWLALASSYFLLVSGSEQPLDSLRFIMTLMAVFLPVALIWVATMAAKSTRIMREESARLQASIEGMRQTYLTSQAVGGPGGLKPSVERKLEEIAAAQRKTEQAITMFTSIRTAAETVEPAEPAPAAPADPDGQGALALGTPADALKSPLSTEDFIRALNFPENAEDKEGFRALRRALQDRPLGDLVRASQDLLTMLSQDGIYMDDLRPDHARPEVWRKFAKGERGRAISGLGGIRDRTCLALTSARMREDEIFRDAAHNFLRRFDTIFSGFEERASDPEIAALANTRTARAFMLMGRVTGTFT